MTELQAGHIVNDWRMLAEVLTDHIRAVEQMRVEDVCANFVTVAEICEQWDFRPTAIGQIRARNKNFPEPVYRAGHTDVFWKPYVDDFMRAYMLTKPTK